SSFTGPVIHRGAQENIERYNALAAKEGAEVLLPGGRFEDEAHGDGCYLKPFVYRMRHSDNARVLREEVFGPHLAIVPFKDLAQAATIYNATDYGLSLAVITEDFRGM